MVSGGILSLVAFFTLGLGKVGGADHALSQQVEELEQLINRQQARIRVLQESSTLPHTGRILSTAANATTPSLYGTPRGYTEDEHVKGALTHIWLIVCGALVVFMQMGFAMLQSGACRMKNAQTVLLNNLMTVCVGTLAWWIFGFTFAFGLDSYDSDGYKKNLFAGGFENAFGLGFMSVREDGQQEPRYDASTSSSPMALWFFQWALCSVTVAIANAGVSERSNPWAFAIFTFCLAALIYPIVVAWTWGKGWLFGNYYEGAPFIDRAGGGIIHIVGGVAALVGAFTIGPRSTRWQEQESAGQRIKEYEPNFDPHSVPLLVLGTFIIWFGMYGLHCGSILTMNSAAQGFLAGQIAMNTTISAATSGLVVYLIRLALTKKHDVPYLCNGILGGLVGIAAGCSNVEVGSAFAIGIISGLVYLGTSSLMKMTKIDDPIDAFAVHAGCGAWGVFAAGLFDWGGFSHISAWSGFRCFMDGGDSCTGGKGVLIVRNITEIVIIIAWVFFLSLIILFPLKSLGILRCNEEDQENGIDELLHFPKKAYNYDVKEEGVKVMVQEDAI